MDQAIQKTSPEGQIAADEKTNSQANIDIGSPIAKPVSFREALVRAQWVTDLTSISYPAGISGPQPHRNDGAPPGRYRYDRNFLLQFQHVCVGRPDIVLPLTDYGLEPSESLRDARVSSGWAMSWRTGRGQRIAQVPGFGSFERNEDTGGQKQKQNTAQSTEAAFVALPRISKNARKKARRKRREAGDPSAPDQANETNANDQSVDSPKE
ncbi:hypothetical protein GY45DRAFT_1320336 [Cubamyces sp. BRFM 1775]|nr:hypothetical protein GY45DRAFT_1320336 [Cubamyces sp. BRFM 1775]